MGHISKGKINKLQQENILKKMFLSTDLFYAAEISASWKHWKQWTLLYCLSCNITVFAPYPPKHSTLCPAEKPTFSEKPMVALMMIRMSCSFYSWRPPCFCHSFKVTFFLQCVLHIVFAWMMLRSGG
jgi:hypothetical protein